MKYLIIRWAARQIRKHVKPEMSYYELAKWGVQDIMKVAGGENAYIL